jgi:hypothetical protein
VVAATCVGVDDVVQLHGQALKGCSLLPAVFLTRTTTQEGIDAVHDVIQHVETYDVTTIRASTPMFLMSRKIKALGVKMVLSGEGSDEVFGGYLYFHKAPNKVGGGGRDQGHFYRYSRSMAEDCFAGRCILQASKHCVCLPTTCQPVWVDHDTLAGLAVSALLSCNASWDIVQG